MITTTEVINGHYELKLIAGNKYRVHFGVNQGIYVYEGILEKSDGYEHLVGAHSFKNIDNEQTFSYYGYSSPYEFTSIVQPIN